MYVYNYTDNTEECTVIDQTKNLVKHLAYVIFLSSVLVVASQSSLVKYKCLFKLVL